MEGIEPSRNHVVERAFSTLVVEICNENGCYVQYSGLESLNALPFDRVPTIKDELQAAAARITQQMNKLIAHLVYRLNRESPVFRLPVDVLMMIFREFKPDHPHEHSSLFNPLLVCRTWYDIIIGSPQLWGFVNGRMPFNLARFLIRRAQPHPISVDWPYNGPDNGKSMLNLFTENSMRIRSINVYAPRWNIENHQTSGGFWKLRHRR
ncbi:hypothetical protein FRC04_000625 [Tulasnella sp. 424]|nr:hypothetical protein FRC04_000625 [Tulasnella sp. 424]KAG8969159.1 hypothetical protein FRC05_001203 [Tulasnella sp. 425]